MPQQGTSSCTFYLLSNSSNSDVVGEQQNSLHAVKKRDPIQLCVSIGKEVSNTILQLTVKDGRSHTQHTQ